MHYLKLLLGIVACLFWEGAAVSGQNTAQIAVDNKNYDFGTIKEEDGPVSHVFVVKNIGTENLVIKGVLASCGCTRPEWPSAPIAPGKTGEVWVAYDPKGRPGPFYKTINIMSNATDRRVTLSISGEVVAKPERPVVTFIQKVGPLELSRNNISFSIVSQNETRKERLWVKNSGTQAVTVRLEKLPSDLNVTADFDTLRPGAVREVLISIHPGQKKLGHVSVPAVLSVFQGKKEIQRQDFPISANIVEDFSKLTAEQKAKAPSIQLSGTMLKFGKVSEKGWLFGLFGSDATGIVEISNSGQSPLLIHSISSDRQELLEIGKLPKKIDAGKTAILKVKLNPKKLESSLDALITLVCNDPNGPVRQIKVTAEKEK